VEEQKETGNLSLRQNSEIAKSTVVSRKKEIRKFWNERARQYGASSQGTLWEMPLRELEIRAISKYLEDDTRVLDVGCGNGYSTIKFSECRRLDITGIDFSSEMIKYAKENLNAFERRNFRQSQVKFMEADISFPPFSPDHFDAVITERCLQNLSSWREQRRAILNIASMLKPRGLFLMAECSFTSLDRLIRFLNFIGKKELVGIVPWHNLFFCDELLMNDPHIRKCLIPLKVDNFASSYTLITRALPDSLHLLARYCPNFGNFGYNKLFLWRKRE
jgi:ubiquinone/menaquinone biosynthesis C-methylase UbiE